MDLWIGGDTQFYRCLRCLILVIIYYIGTELEMLHSYFIKEVFHSYIPNIGGLLC